MQRFTRQDITPLGIPHPNQPPQFDVVAARAKMQRFHFPNCASVSTVYKHLGVFDAGIELYRTGCGSIVVAVIEFVWTPEERVLPYTPINR